MKKQLTMTEVRKTLEDQTAWLEDGAVEYRLDVEFAGEEETFFARRNADEYFADVPAEYDDDFGASCVEVESANDGRFDSVCEELLKKANAWLAKQKCVWMPLQWRGKDEVNTGYTTFKGLLALVDDLEDELHETCQTWMLDDILNSFDEDAFVNGSVESWDEKTGAEVSRYTQALTEKVSISAEITEKFEVDENGDMAEFLSRVVDFSR